MNLTATNPDALLGWMGSLADGTRLRLLRLLERHELGVADLCDVLRMPQSTVSRHLKVLSDQGWVTSHRRGTQNLYRMILDEIDPAARKLWLVARDNSEDWAVLQQDQIRLKRQLRKRRTDAEAFFSGAAEEWARLREQLYGSRFTNQAMLALLPANWIVADLGCGTGSVVSALAPHVKEVVGIDNNPTMLEAARATCEDMPNVRIREGDLEALPLQDETCDAALMLIVLAYAEQVELVLAEATRIIRTGGKLVIVDLLKHEDDTFRRQTGQRRRGFSTDEITELLASAGFGDQRCAALELEPEAKSPALLLASAIKQT